MFGRHVQLFGLRITQVATLHIMSVLLETSLGDLVIDLLVDYAPKASEK
jgi:hypothetical protein